MSSSLFGRAEQKTDELRAQAAEKIAPSGSSAASPPAFADIAKAANDLLSKDFYHVAAANLEVKTKTPNGVNYTVKGKSAHDGALTGSLESKYNDKASGVTNTISWNTLNAVDYKLELDQNIAKGLKAEALATFKPENAATGAKLNLYFKQPAFHVRAFVDLLKGPTATVDAALGHEGFVVGAEAGYDVKKAAVTRYSAAVGYSDRAQNAAITATNNLSVFAASYFHQVNSAVQVGAKATYDSKTSSTVGLELAGKYVSSPLTFIKGKVDDKGLAAVSWNTKVGGGLTMGLGAQVQTQKINQSAHKLGAHFAFEG